MSKFKVLWWIHGAGRICRGTDIVKGSTLDKDDVEELIEKDLHNMLHTEECCFTPNLPNFYRKHSDKQCEARGSEVSNWGIVKITKMETTKP